MMLFKICEKTKKLLKIKNIQGPDPTLIQENKAHAAQWLLEVPGPLCQRP